MKRKIIMVGLVVTGLFMSFSANAAFMRYTYTGNPFTFISSGLPSGLTGVTGYFDVPLDFGPNFNDVFTPTGFAFNNGVESVTDAMTFRASFFSVTTDGSGDLTAWVIFNEQSAFNEGDFIGIDLANDLNIILNIFDATGYCAEDNVTGFCSGVPGADASALQASVFDSPGTWTKSTVVPVPAAVWLFGSALGLLGWMRRRKAA
jgi:hypothetical protein